MNKELEYNFKIEGRDSQALYNNLTAALEYEARNDEMFANALLRVSAQIYHDRCDDGATSNRILNALDDGYDNGGRFDDDWNDDDEDYGSDYFDSDLADYESREDFWHKEDEDEDAPPTYIS